MLCVGWLALVPSFASAQGAPPLPALQAEIGQSSVSGLSSGAYMAGQFQVAHSSIVIGAAIVAGGPYGCAESAASRLAPLWTLGVGYNLTQALQGCMENKLSAWGIPDVKALARRAKDFAEQARIDPLSALAADRVYLYSGAADKVLLEPIVAAAREFYRLLGVPDGNVTYLKGSGAGHAIVTEAEGAACGVTEPPFITDCDYDQAGALLQHIYGPLAAPASSPSAEFTEFDQRAFSKNLSNHGMAETGAVFVPRACREGAGCRVHVAFHGCTQGREFVGDAHVKGAGLARWADANRIIVLFPQIASNSYNPKGCWDWWGYTQLDFLTKEAPQIAAVRGMIGRLAAAR